MKHSHEYADLLVEQAKVEATSGVDFARAQVTCRASECGRVFTGIPALRDHAEAVHTFDDIRRLVSEAIREEYGKAGQYQASPPIPAIWVWIDDLADDWVAFVVEEGNDMHLFKASYSITDNVVTLGEPTEVRRRTVYEPVKES